MRASAHLTVARAAGAAGSRIARLHSDPPLVLRPTNPAGAEPMRHWLTCGASPARVSLAAGAAGPVGGDDLRLTIDVGAGASLVLRSVSAMLVLPGPHGLPSRTEVSIRIAAGGTLIWLPGPVIAARSCDHRAVTRVTMAEDARLLLREELLLGRHGEQPGAVRQRLRVCLDECPLHDQELAVGPGATGWHGPAVTGGRRALGSALIVDPACAHALSGLPATECDTDTALMPLSGPAVLVSALAPDGLALRRQLDRGIAGVETALQRSHDTERSPHAEGDRTPA